MIDFNLLICTCLCITDLFAEDLFEVTSCYFPVDFTPVSILGAIEYQMNAVDKWLIRHILSHSIE